HPVPGPARGTLHRRRGRALRRPVRGRHPGRRQRLLPVALRHHAGLRPRHPRHRRPVRRARPAPGSDGGADGRLDPAPSPRPGPPAPVSPLHLAWRGLSRQPARAFLGLTGVAVVGALLFDMLMLSRGLIVSFRDLLESTGFDVRVTATEALPGMGPAMADLAATTETLRALPEVAAVLPVRFGSAAVEGRDDTTPEVAIIGSETRRRGEWRLVEGADLSDGADGGRPDIVVN